MYIPKTKQLLKNRRIVTGFLFPIKPEQRDQGSRRSILAKLVQIWWWKRYHPTLEKIPESNNQENV